MRRACGFRCGRAGPYGGVGRSGPDCRPPEAGVSAGGCGWIAVVEIARAGAVCCMIRGRGAELIALWKRACACGGIADSGGNRLFRDVSAEGRKQVSGAGIAERRMPPTSTTSSSLRTARLHSSMRCARRRGTVSPPPEILGRAASEQAANAPAGDRDAPGGAMGDVFRATQ